MINTDALMNLTDRCDVYLENSLISKEQIIKRYANFFASELSVKNHAVNIALHTGSICFDAISLIIAALGCILFDKTHTDEIIASFSDGDIVLYKNERYRWRGHEIMNGSLWIKLEQDGRGKNGPSTRWISHETNRGLIKPYLGTSEVTDGRGIRKSKDSRADFISYFFGVPETEIPSIIGTSVVIVTEREYFLRIANGLRIEYDNGRTINLLDIVTASYFTDGGEEYRFGNNPAKTEPVLKVAGRISVARNLVLDKRSNPTVGLMVVGANAVRKGGSELTDLLGRKSLKFAHIITNIDFENAEDIVDLQPDAAIFACTKEFLLSNSLPLIKLNTLTSELDRQVSNILNNNVTTVNVDGSCSWEEMKKAREALHDIKRSSLDERLKRDFIISAYSLLNILTTAVFPLQELEDAAISGKLNMGVTSPMNRINELWKMAETSGSMEYTCALVIDIIERKYKSLIEQCPKHDALFEFLRSDTRNRVAVIVPKAYYIDILSTNENIIKSGATVVTANRFDSSIDYSKIIAVGDIMGKRFEPLKCRAAEDIIVLLYDCEAHIFRHKKKRAKDFENKLNIRMQIAICELVDDDSELRKEVAESDSIDTDLENTTDLEAYIDSISIFDIKKFATDIFASTGNIPTSEVCAIGKFASGEQILFSKYYTAVVFEVSKGMVTEVTSDKLDSGDILIFAKRDDYTRNMVDYIYDGLLSSGKLSNEIADATEKAFYWKEALREYRDMHRLSYKAIASRFRKLGSSIQEASIRHWLIEESHIVGPRDEKTLEYIAMLTNDPYLMKDTHSYFEACRIVRRQRKEILNLISRAIEDKLKGNAPPKSGLFESVYENIERLSESLELESIATLNEPILAPINIVNRPLTEAEVTV